MTTELGKQTINTWEWLDAFCLTQRGDCNLACGQHGIVVVQVDNFLELKLKIGEDRARTVLEKLSSIMEEYDMEDTLIARYNDYTFAVVLHYLATREEINEVCEEIISNIRQTSSKWQDPITVSIGAAECHHDPGEGYKCAARLAMDALVEAKKQTDCFVLAPDILPPHPLAVAKAMSE